MLFEKLKRNGFCEDAINWFQSYLTGHLKLVLLRNTFTSLCEGFSKVQLMALYSF